MYPGENQVHPRSLLVAIADERDSAGGMVAVDVSALLAAGAGRRFRKLRIKQGFSPSKLAKESGIDLEYVYDVERNPAEVPLGILTKFVAALGESPRFINSCGHRSFGAECD